MPKDKHNKIKKTQKISHSLLRFFSPSTERAVKKKKFITAQIVKELEKRRK